MDTGLKQGLVSLEPHRNFVGNPAVAGRYDVVVTGSGCGGGILAANLAERGAKVALLEAGGITSLTHFANIPRSQPLVDYTHQNIDLYHRLQSRNATSSNSKYRGGQFFGLGGKMNLWGGLAPRMSPEEFRHWPAEIANDLLGAYYDRAEALMGVAGRSSAYGSAVATHLRSATGTELNPAGFAFGLYGEGESWRRFSTVDLFSEGLLTGDMRKHPDLFLFHPVNRLVEEGGRIVSAVAYSVLEDREIVFKADRYVLAAGVLGSPLLAERSGLALGKARGTGFTDHPVQYARFYIDGDSGYFRQGESAKLMGQVEHKEPFNVLFHMNTDLDNESVVGTAARGFSCEVVFLHSFPLNDDNRIYHTGDERNAFSDAHIDVEGPVLAPEIKQLTHRIARDSIEALGGTLLESTELVLNQAPVGNAGNEVGSMRLSEAAGTGVFDANLKAHALANLYGCDASVFPHAAAANPTLTIGALALRLADRLAA